MSRPILFPPTTFPLISARPYVPPRAAWKGNPATRGIDPPANTIAMDLVNHSSAANHPVELPVQNTSRKPRSNTGPSTNPIHTRNKSSDNYYEDVDPRFASPTPSPQTFDNRHLPQVVHQPHSNSPMPSSLMPGLATTGYPSAERKGEIIDPTSPYDDIQDGQRSPASDRSNMTSISQRGANASWQINEQQGRLAVLGKRMAQQQQRDMVLESNREFGVPGRTEGISPVRAMVPPPTEHGQAF